ncbi:MAG TPA: MarR family transcriptional regulator [Terricaulis sp.]|nr:MarR family transcriptional regulator [Terricaulis sp.]
MSDQAEAEPYRLAASASHLLHRAEQLASDRFTQLVDGIITLRQFAVLAAIAQRPGLRQSDLVRETGIDRSTLADMLSRMQKRAWVTRAAHALDQRAQAVQIAPAGAAILASVTKHARAADAAILDALPRTKSKAFLNLLVKLAAVADETAEKAERNAKRLAKRQAKARAKAQGAAKAKARVRQKRTEKTRD